MFQTAISLILFEHMQQVRNEQALCNLGCAIFHLFNHNACRPQAASQRESFEHDVRPNRGHLQAIVKGGYHTLQPKLFGVAQNPIWEI